MTAKPLYAFLAEFRDNFPAPANDAVERDLTEHLAELEDARAQAYALGLEEGRSEGALAIEEARAQAAAELSQAREIWAQEEAARLGSRLEEALSDIQNNVCDLVGSILRRVIEEAMRKRTIDSLANALLDQLTDAKQPILRLSGRRDLIESLRAKISAKAISVDLDVTDDPEITIVDGATRFQTRLEHWRQALSADIAAEDANV